MIASLLAYALPAPLFELPLNGALPEGKARPGILTVSAPNGTGWHFDGIASGIELTDAPKFALTNSLTLSAWINLDEYVPATNSAPGAMIVFRGDDRSGLDPYRLVVGPDGTVSFAITNEKDQSAGVTAPIPLHIWVHVCGSLDGETGEMKLWLDNKLISYTKTLIRPLGILDGGSMPGVGIGNVQRSGFHNIPLHGAIASVKIFNRAYAPSQFEQRYMTPRPQLR